MQTESWKPAAAGQSTVGASNNVYESYLTSCGSGTGGQAATARWTRTGEQIMADRPTKELGPAVDRVGGEVHDIYCCKAKSMYRKQQRMTRVALESCVPSSESE